MAGEPANNAFVAEQYDAIYPPGVERHYWNRCRNRVIAHQLQSAEAKGPILEVGCGKGLVVADLRRRGFDITGIELAEVTPVDEARSHVRTGMDVMEMESQYSATVRTVLLLDVIEHLEDPAAFVAGLRAKFPALELLIVTVPARQELFSNYDRFNGHFRRYDLPTSREHMDPDRTRSWRGSYFYHALYPAARIQLRLAGERATEFRVPGAGLASKLHAFLGWCFYLEYRLLPSRWWGTSIIAAVRDRK
jgi:hypothetical protein